ncbi:MAG: cellulase family glycosylhydrolase [Phycisphaerae bacterium]|nr:cellulase family glycosylhydrolase [Phycisphaerae bacterium]
MLRKWLHLFLMGIVLFPCSLAFAAPPKKTQYRGFTISDLDRETLEEAAKNWQANKVRYMMCPEWQKQPGETKLQCWKRLVAKVAPGLDIAKELGLAVVLDLHQIPNDHPAPIPPNPDPKKNPHWDSIQWWNDESYLRVMIECWRDLAEVCKNRDQVIWFDLLNEPLEWSVVHKHPSYPPNWPRWAQQVIHEIRKIDKTHPIVVEPGPGMLCWGFKGFPPLKDPYRQIIYSFHPYQPLEYTHQGVYDGVKIFAYPGETGDSGGGMWDAKRIEDEMAPVIEFQKKYGVRIWVGEFSVARWAPDAQRWLRDSIEIFEKHGWDWSYHALREAGVWRLVNSDQANLVRKDKNGKDEVFHALASPEMNEKGITYLRYGTPSPIGDAPAPQGLTDRGKVVLEYMKRNVKAAGK